ncbi:hypothetical protein ACRB68_69100 [Actinomadura sp. RB68]|uniref:Uncharacterized protein n=2 Tax=Actinomadura macrotermitis TaxID=2585200 RepID=A0A7K0C5R9_9ACTN|nr:hypothetical protein [Actinomadura macrotermitis]
MNGAARGHWELDHDGHRLRVESERRGWLRTARLTVDGEPAGQDEQVLFQARFPYGEHTVLVGYDLRGLLDGQAARVRLDPPEPKDGGNKDGDAKDDAAKPEGVAFTPPEGTRAARRERFAMQHPGLYASRHVVLAVGKVLFGLLGVAALIKALLALVPWPELHLPKIPWPDLDLPSLPLPDIDLPDVALPGWLTAVLATTKFWLPVLIAIGVARKEAERRRRQRDARQNTEPAAGPAAGPAGSAAQQREKARAGQHDHDRGDR